MKYEVIIDKKALEYLERLPKNVRIRIRNKIDGLAGNPRPSGCKALQGEFKGLTRIRVGDYRIIYEIIDNMLIIAVLTVAPRGGVYS
jgi:mRNA interferase RelE/StbE